MAKTKKEKFLKVKTFLNDLLVYHGGEFTVCEVTLNQAIDNLHEDEMKLIVTEGDNNNG